jgi:uncharacterized protein (TIGR02001 family)
VGLAGTSAGLHARPLQSSGEVALASQLVDQGLAITTDTPVLQAAMAWSSPGGWSFGLAGAVETRAPGHPVVLVARASRAWSLSDDWLAQASVLRYDYRGEQGRRFPDRSAANLYFSFRDLLTVGASASRASGSGRWLAAADLAANYPLLDGLSLTLGAGIAEAVDTPRYPDYPGGYPGGYRGVDQGGGGDAGRGPATRRYGHGSLGLAWSGGPWRLELDRNWSSLGAREVYGTRAASDWVASLAWRY